MIAVLDNHKIIAIADAIKADGGDAIHIHNVAISLDEGSARCACLVEYFSRPLFESMASRCYLPNLNPNTTHESLGNESTYFHSHHSFFDYCVE